jgi:hypothetical protein
VASISSVSLPFDSKDFPKILDLVSQNRTAMGALIFVLLIFMALVFFGPSRTAAKMTAFILLLALGLLLLGVFGSAKLQLQNSDFHIARNDLPADKITCLDDAGKGEIIPGGTRVCASMHGSWFGPWGFGISPVGDLRDHPPTYKNHTTLWTIGAKSQSPKTSESPYIHPNEFYEKEDYAVCVKPPAGAVVNPNDAMAIEIKATSRPHCPDPAVQ